MFYDYFWAFKRPAEVVNFKSISNLPFLFGVVIYSYEGVGMILPVEASMKRKEKFPLTLAFVMTIITVIYVSFGAVGAQPCCMPPSPPLNPLCSPRNNNLLVCPVDGRICWKPREVAFL